MPEQQSCMKIESGTDSNPVLIRWSSNVGRPSPWDSYALRTTAGWVLIDPDRPTAEIEGRLENLIDEVPIATVLTSDGHERSCYDLRDRWGIPVWGPATEPAQRPVAYEGKPDHIYDVETELPGGLVAHKLRGAWQGDHALLWRDEGILFTGDILNGQVERSLVPEDHYRYHSGIYFGARAGYIDRHEDPEGLKESILPLLGWDFDTICGSHGTPFRDDVKSAVTRLLDTI